MPEFFDLTFPPLRLLLRRKGLDIGEENGAVRTRVLCPAAVVMRTKTPLKVVRPARVKAYLGEIRLLKTR